MDVSSTAQPISRWQPVDGAVRTIAISVVCKEGVASPGEEFNEFIRKVTYPFRVNQLKPVNLTGLCKITKADDIKFIGDFSSDAQFFVFTGVMCLLFSILR